MFLPQDGIARVGARVGGGSILGANTKTDFRKSRKFREFNRPPWLGLRRGMRRSGTAVTWPAQTAGTALTSRTPMKWASARGCDVPAQTAPTAQTSFRSQRWVVARSPRELRLADAAADAGMSTSLAQIAQIAQTPKTSMKWASAGGHDVSAQIAQIAEIGRTVLDPAADASPLRGRPINRWWANRGRREAVKTGNTESHRDTIACVRRLCRAPRSPCVQTGWE